MHTNYVIQKKYSFCGRPFLLIWRLNRRHLGFITVMFIYQTPLQFFVSDREFLDHFAINSAGELVLRRSLDYETQDHYAYQVMVTDGVMVS